MVEEEALKEEALEEEEIEEEALEYSKAAHNSVSDNYCTCTVNCLINYYTGCWVTIETYQQLCI